jgi:tRNA A-37 threonylcarbamoyl transferase component Bud32
MNWPTPQEYNEAIQVPTQNFSDEELRKGSLELTRFGLPRAQSGYFANVYHMRCGKRNLAVRCFLHGISDERARYEILSDALPEYALDYFLPFEFIQNGIRVMDTWYPIVKMEWAQGETLDTYIRRHIHSSDVLAELAENFKQMVVRLQASGIAHGDLQHGNMLVVDGGIKLVDYDGLFIEKLSTFGTAELGHPNYQHPMRSHLHYNAALDNFSAWSIYLALRCLSLDGSLLDKLSGADECVLFRATDYKHPTKSKTLAFLESHELEEVADNSRILRRLCMMDIDDVPAISEVIPIPQDLPVIEPDPEPAEIVLGISTQPQDMALDRPRGHLPALADEWPSLNDYVKAITLTKYVFDDAELQDAKLIEKEGSVAVGKNGVVFHMQTATGLELAVKCFLKRDNNREWRYGQLQDFAHNEQASGSDSQYYKYFLPFRYKPQGIKIRGTWYPIVVTPWINGQRLDKFIQRHVKSRWLAPRIRRLIPQFRQMILALESMQIAHGDLEPGNIIVGKKGLVLVDYDAIYIPNKEEFMAPELGHKDFQHPKRTEQDWGLFIHNFPAWIIDTALRAIVSDFGLARRCSSTNRPLLFAAADYVSPGNSPAFAFIDMQAKSEVRLHGNLLKNFLGLKVSEIPPLRNGKTPNSFALEHDLTPTLCERPKLLIASDRRVQQRWIYSTVYSLGFISTTGAMLFTSREYYETIFGMMIWLLLYESAIYSFEKLHARYRRSSSKRRSITQTDDESNKQPLAILRQGNVNPGATLLASLTAVTISSFAVMQLLPFFLSRPELVYWPVFLIATFYCAYIKTVRRPVHHTLLALPTLTLSTEVPPLKNAYGCEVSKPFALRPQETLFSFAYFWLTLGMGTPFFWFIMMGVVGMLSRGIAFCIKLSAGSDERTAVESISNAK